MLESYVAEGLPRGNRVLGDVFDFRRRWLRLRRLAGTHAFRLLPGLVLLRHLMLESPALSLSHFYLLKSGYSSLQSDPIIPKASLRLRVHSHDKKWPKNR